MPWDQSSLISIRETLARLYPRDADARRVIEDAGLDPSLIAYDPKPINNWFLILQDARNRAGKVERILAVTLAENPDNEALQRAAAGTPPPVVEGPEARDWRGPVGPRLEKIIGTESTLVPIRYLELGLERSKAVAKIRLPGGGAGTGFLVRDGLLVTNYHVLPEPGVAATAFAVFNYQQTAEGPVAEADERRLLPDAWFRSSLEDDWAAVRVDGDPAARWGAIELAPAMVKIGDRVNIIQHPGGLQKKVSLYSNVVVFVGANRLQYLTDTEPGSSGSPVFDREWNLVALHHSGGWLTEPGGSDPNRQYYRNEGILIDAVIAGLAG